MNHNSLLTSLKHEQELLFALLAQLERQQQALVACLNDEILAASQQSEALLRELQQATLARLAQQQDYASLDDATESAPDLRVRTQLKATVAQLRQGREALIRIQQRNQRLADQGLSWVDATLSSFVQLQQQGQPAVYGAKGTEASDWNPERSLCDYNA
ncbi:MAG: hypothetical protein CVV27_15085 [Candidatus Melainabacteria bacterium HGW-Melainabacteria-1]|nr:MAG: hypothetical protein CVV27_15085 [Candidatus Melainabacteria bacterium HGW-Melainabacteria-1]